MPDREKSPPEQPAKEPPAFGSVPERGDGLATGLGVAQPTAVDQPEPRSDTAKDDDKSAGKQG